ncbi:thiopeptide-type bacteriocin biosynthesis protein [Streptomyces erythrochromogenes]|uniref:thiopeptide-type bacteriocin biosynthesis protein n=1 Tax=Streptomyces erythrochromogenes TaxID=285574 RepID=UPI0022525933|nr:thiopeptide-type bacteriocin biosynthesis protein [Streptomyces erythrochromogenes]MCX5588620.1 thiopeptide-type bacteriocin biosynthesis protein [Streptomyces erythrochromogenes]
MKDPLLQADWWYARLYPGGLDHLDQAVVRCLPPLVDLAQELGADRWFFIQYTDWKGPHLRLRIHGERDTVDRLHRRLPRIALDLEVLARESVPSRGALVPFESGPFSGCHAGVATALYEPEEGKYGGPLGTELAEEVFQHSSDLALWAANLQRHPDRAALATLLLRASAAALQEHVTGTDTAWFWERHLAWWTHDGGRGAAELRTRLRTCAATDEPGIRSRVAELAHDPEVRVRLRAWTEVLSAYLGRAAAGQVPYSAGHLVFHQAHMMCNRLGVLPREEALLGILAAEEPGST